MTARLITRLLEPALVPAQVALWSTLSSALTLACLRTHGQAETAAVEYEAQRRQHRRWLPAVAGPRLGAQACAQVQAEAERGQGLSPVLVADGDRTWLLYGPPHWMTDGVTAPSMAPAALGPAVGCARFQACHAQTARAVGAGVVFVHASSITEGDIADAGYFTLAAGDDDRDGYRRIDEPLPAAVRRALAGPPTARFDEAAGQARLGASRVQGAALRMIVLGERLGPVAAAAVIEHAFRIGLTAHWAQLPGWLGLPPVRSPHLAAQLFARVASLVGDHCTLDEAPPEPQQGAVRLTLQTDDLWRDHPNAPLVFKEAILRAWSASLTHHGFHLRARAVFDESAGRIAQVVFDNGGPTH